MLLKSSQLTEILFILQLQESLTSTYPGAIEIRSKNVFLLKSLFEIHTRLAATLVQSLCKTDASQELLNVISGIGNGMKFV